jgi:hypothetical protein
MTLSKDFTLACATATMVCLAFLAPLAMYNEAAAQTSLDPGLAQAYYSGYGAGYQSGYGNGYGPYGYGRYGSTRYGYTGYGNGPYGYRLPAPYAYQSGYGYGNGDYNSLYYRALRLHGGTYRPTYNPNVVQYYSPYGNGSY